MHISIKATGCELSDGSRAFIEEKLSRVKKVIGQDTAETLLACEIEESVGVMRAGAKYRADATLSLDGAVFRAEAASATLETVVDRIRDELIRKVTRTRGKNRSLFRRGGARIKRLILGE